MFTDMAGYTALMQSNEELAVKSMNKLKEIQLQAIKLFKGRIIKYIGDGTLIIFKSALNAVRCAIDIQNRLYSETNIDLKIGIHSGDIVIEKDDIYGDSVNIASRIENLSIPGSVMISGKVHDEIINHLEFKSKSLGHFILKNVKHPVEVFVLVGEKLTVPKPKDLKGRTETESKKTEELLFRLKWGRPEFKYRKIFRIIAVSFLILILIVIIVAVIKTFNEKSPDKTIAVLPFKNLSTDPEQEFFSDGITDDIIMQLYKIGELRVTSRTSVVQYKDSKKSLPKIGKELNVNYLLEGTVRREEDRVLITAQLINARTDEHIWAERYDERMTRIFAIQSNVATRIAKALKAELTREEVEQIEKVPTDNLTAYDFYLKGREYYFKYNLEDNLIAIELFKRAITYDTNYAIAYAGLGSAYARMEFETDEEYWLDSALMVSEMAIQLDPKLAEGLKALGLVYSLKGQQKKALKYFRKAVAINPNYIQAYHNIGVVYFDMGQLNKAVRFYNKARALNPDKLAHLENIGEVYFILNDDVNALNCFYTALQIRPNNIFTLLYLYKIHTIRKEFEKALQISEQIYEIDKNLYEHYIRTFGIYLTSGNLELAGGNFDKAIEIIRKESHKTDTILPPINHLESINFYNSMLYTCLYYIKTDKRNIAEKLLDKQLEYNLKLYKEGNVSIIILRNISYIYALKGEKEDACTWLQKAVNKGWREYRQELATPLFENIREEPQFKSVINKMKSAIEDIRGLVEIELEKE